MADVEALNALRGLVQPERLAQRDELPPNRGVARHLEAQALLGVGACHLQPACAVAPHLVADGDACALHGPTGSARATLASSISSVQHDLGGCFAAQVVLLDETVEQLLLVRLAQAVSENDRDCR